MVQPKKPEHILKLDSISPKSKRLILLKRFILIHLIRAVNENTRNLTVNSLIEILSRNMGSIEKTQVKIYVENLLYYGYIFNELNRGIVLTDKIYDDLKAVNTIIRQNAKIWGLNR